MSLRLRISFDVLDAAVHECLHDYLDWAGPYDAIVQFQRKQVTPALVVYRITEAQPGDLGTVKVRKVGEGVSELAICAPPDAPMRDPTAEELASIQDLRGNDYYQARVALGERILQETLKANQKRWDTHKFIIDAFLGRLQEDIALQEHALQAEGAKAPEPQRRAGRALTWVKLKRVRQLIEEGKTKTQACRMVGMDIRTYNAYEADLEELEVEEE
jgi:hypothetical protein